MKQHPPLLKKFLIEATKGVWGKKRLEVQEELIAHILERAYKHEVSGLNHEDAVVKAIAEIGDAKTIRAGMIGVYTMPNLFKVSGVLTVLAAGVITVLGVSRAQITGTTRVPIEECANPQVASIKVTSSQTPTNFACKNGFWLSVESLRKTLEPLGVKIRPMENANVGKFKIIPWSFEFPQGGTAYVGQPEMLHFNNSSESYPYLPGYLEANAFINSLQILSVPVTMSGWNNPIIRIGQIKFSIGSNQSPVHGEDWYKSSLRDVFQSFMAGWTNEYVLADSNNYIETHARETGFPLLYRKYTHQIQTELPIGQIVVLLERNAPRVIQREGKDQNLPNMARAYVTTVGQDGVVSFPSDSKSVRFVGTVRDLRAGKPDEAIDVAVLKFTSQLNQTQQMFSVVSPSKLSK